MNALRHGLTAATLVLNNEDKREVRRATRQPTSTSTSPPPRPSRTSSRKSTVSKWLQRRCWALQTALLDVTMDRMEDEIDEEFTDITERHPHRARVRPAERTQSDALALLNRYAGRHSREWHKAVDKLRAHAKRRAAKRTQVGAGRTQSGLPGAGRSAPANPNPRFAERTRAAPNSRRSYRLRAARNSAETAAGNP